MASLKKIRRQVDRVRLEIELLKAEAEVKRLAFTPLKSVVAEAESIKLEQRVIPAEALTLAEVAVVKRLAQVVGGGRIEATATTSNVDEHGQCERGPDLLAIVRSTAATGRRYSLEHEQNQLGPDSWDLHDHTTGKIVAEFTEEGPARKSLDALNAFEAMRTATGCEAVCCGPPPESISITTAAGDHTVPTAEACCVVAGGEEVPD